MEQSNQDPLSLALPPSLLCLWTGGWWDPSSGLSPSFSLKARTGHWTHYLIQCLTSLDVMSHVLAFSFLPFVPPSGRRNKEVLGAHLGVHRCEEGPGGAASSQVPLRELPAV